MTGCDTGFGNILAKRLDALGCHVFAGCFTPSGGAELKNACSDRLKVVTLDVSNAESVKKAFDIVKAALPEGKGTVHVLALVYSSEPNMFIWQPVNPLTSMVVLKRHIYIRHIIFIINYRHACLLSLHVISVCLQHKHASPAGRRPPVVPFMLQTNRNNVQRK